MNEWINDKGLGLLDTALSLNMCHSCVLLSEQLIWGAVLEKTNKQRDPLFEGTPRKLKTRRGSPVDTANYLTN